MVIEEGAWDLEAFRRKLSKEIIQRIMNILPQHPLVGLGKICWTQTTNRNFSVKDAYRLRTKRTWSAQGNKWKEVWKYQGPHRVRFFLWLVCKQRLLTNLEKARRGIGQDISCQICYHNTKDILHVLRECPTTEEV